MGTEPGSKLFESVRAMMVAGAAGGWEWSELDETHRRVFITAESYIERRLRTLALPGALQASDAPDAISDRETRTGAVEAVLLTRLPALRREIVRDIAESCVEAADAGF